jgi:SAM-dependent methyltransferase
MRQTEVDYWDQVAEKTAPEPGMVYDNWLKRRVLAQLLLKCDWIKQKVLEIGVGNGVSACMLAMSCGRMWDYIGTDLSPKFMASAENFGLKMVQADVLSLPEGQFTRILALDSLEHVRPEDRPEGYRNIAERLSPQGLLFINMPKNMSLHEDEFDHGIDVSDVAMLEKCGLTLREYKQYDIQYGNYRRDYAFVVMTK